MANTRENGESFRFPAKWETRNTTGAAASNSVSIPYFEMQQPDYLLSAVVPAPTLAGYNYIQSSPETSAMVTALSHVISGDQPQISGALTSFAAAGGGSAAWVGQKRRLDRQDSYVYRGFAESSSSVKSG